MLIAFHLLVSLFTDHGDSFNNIRMLSGSGNLVPSLVNPFAWNILPLLLFSINSTSYCDKFVSWLGSFIIGIWILILIITFYSLAFIAFWSHLFHFLHFCVIKRLTSFFVLETEPGFIKGFLRYALYAPQIKTSDKKYYLHAWLCKLIKHKFNFTIIIYPDLVISKIAPVP